MKANINIKNVGGLKGDHSFEFECGKINLVSAPNAIGKTSLIRALVAALSIPNGDMHSFMLEEAIRLGIKSDARSAREGFVNLYSPSASVSLEYDGKTRKYEVSGDGSVREQPEGDERFMLAGVLTNDSRTVNQLLIGNDDFSWAVEKLSLAKYYEQLKEIIQTRKEEIEEKRDYAEQQSKKLHDLNEELEKLEKQKNVYSKRQDDLSTKHKNLKSNLDRINESTNKMNKKREDLRVFTGNLNNLEKRQKKLEKYGNSTFDKLKQKETELEAIDIHSIEKKAEEIRKKCYSEMETEKEKRIESQRTLNLFQDALTEFDSRGVSDVKCPLCKKSTISVEEVQRTIKDTTSKIGNLGDNISNLNFEISKANNLVTNEKKKIDEIKEQIDELESKKRSIEREISAIIADTTSIKTQIERTRSSIQEDEKRLIKDKSDISNIDEKVYKELTEIDVELKKLSDRIGELKQERQESSEEQIEGQTVDPLTAKKIYEAQIEFLEKNGVRYAADKAFEHREIAKDRFNENINELMQKLGFKTFGNIRLNKDNRLLVERVPGHRLQEVKTLSMSEKLAIGTLLQIALKETYIPELPFFIMDDVVLDFDETRKKRILEYLSDEAKAKSMYVIVTKLVEDGTSVKINRFG